MTKIHHTFTTKQHNAEEGTFHKLKDEEGRETKIIQEMKSIASSYFQNLFSSEAGRNYDHLLSRIERCIFEEDNQRLTALYTKKEIRDAVLEMGPIKTLREDGLPTIFTRSGSILLEMTWSNFVYKFSMMVRRLNK